MIDLIKKTILAGIGASVVTKEALEKQLNELVERGKLSTEDACKARDEILKEGKKEFEDSRERLAKEVDDLLAKAHFATQKDLKALETRLAAVEKDLSKHAADKKAHAS